MNAGRAGTGLPWAALPRVWRHPALAAGRDGRRAAIWDVIDPVAEALSRAAADGSASAWLAWPLGAPAEAAASVLDDCEPSLPCSFAGAAVEVRLYAPPRVVPPAVARVVGRMVAELLAEAYGGEILAALPSRADLAAVLTDGPAPLREWAVRALWRVPS
ncbi:MAG TPA: hypothetical protein VFS33_05745 [Gemmatimonadales bacterium]|nr:hypothetical protein [Gemmatimonadales bacterium]